MLEDNPVALAVIAAILIYAIAVPLPGPSFVAVTRTTMMSGRTAGAFAALGVTLAAAIYALATLLGISALLATLPWLVTAVQLGGGAYLVFLGISLLRAHFRRQAPLTEPLPLRHSRIDHAESRQALIKGFAATIGNPKMAAFFLGLFAPIAEQPLPMGARIMVLVGVVLVDLTYHQALVQLAALVGQSSPARYLQRWLDAAAGSVMAIFGLALISKAVSGP